jgi:hypothetical protein
MNLISGAILQVVYEDIQEVGPLFGPVVVGDLGDHIGL